MEPRYSMTAYAVVIISSLTLLAARGFHVAVYAIALGVLASATLLEFAYLIRRKSDRALPHRRRLDRIVRFQWIGIAAIGSLVAIGVSQLKHPPLAGCTPVLQALIVGTVIAMPVVYLSALVDWYWVLPKVSGMTGPGPCETAGGERFAGVTKIWFFHRAVATTVVTFALAGVPGYMAGISGDGGSGAAWVITGSALAIGFNGVNDGLVAAFRYAFNPRIYVGDVIRVRAHPEDHELKDAFVLDISINGLTYKLLEDVSLDDPSFHNKGVPLRMNHLEQTNKSQNLSPPCESADACCGINWYCFRNPNANTVSDHAALPPARWSH